MQVSGNSLVTALNELSSEHNVVPIIASLVVHLQGKPNPKEIKVPDETEPYRRQRLAEINAQPGSREALEAEHGQVWNAEELSADFEVTGFLAPFVVVRRKSDGKRGSLEFQHQPRIYFGFSPHDG
jgi:hypothetical protein